MKFANHDDRATLIVGESGAEAGIDVATLSEGRFGPSPAAVLDEWAEFRGWVESGVLDTAHPDVVLRRELLGPPSPRPFQTIAIGLNYADHAAEVGMAVPENLPPLFPKWSSALTGAEGEIELVEGGTVDWEVEVVAVIGRTAHQITPEQAWDHVAGLSVGQDISERTLQMSGPAPQFGFAKSYPGFAPVGPWLVTTDELRAAGHDPDDLALGCSIDGETVQDGRTSNLIFSIPLAISKLSQVLTLQPGDLVFTGTPDGVGMGLTPPRYLRAGEVLRTWVSGIGELEHRFVAPR